jgi:hypothetical protein
MYQFVSQALATQRRQEALHDAETHRLVKAGTPHRRRLADWLHRAG